VPVRADLYGKKGGLGFVLWFKGGRLFRVMEESAWSASGKNGSFKTDFGVICTPQPGPGSSDSEMDFALAGLGGNASFGGQPVVSFPSIDLVKVNGNKWLGTAATGFKATANAKTGLLSGSVTFLVGSGDRPRKVRGTFAGVVTGGAGYGTVVVKGVGSFAAKIAPCGSCSI
jgi:hypothetical protein